MAAGMLVQANLHLGRVEDAIRFADAAIEEMDASGELILAPEILRLGATAHLERDADTDVARRLLELCRRGDLPKPSIAPFVIDPAIQGVPLRDGTADLQEADSLLVSLA